MKAIVIAFCCFVLLGCAGTHIPQSQHTQATERLPWVRAKAACVNAGMQIPDRRQFSAMQYRLVKGLYWIDEKNGIGKKKAVSVDTFGLAIPMWLDQRSEAQVICVPAE